MNRKILSIGLLITAANFAVTGVADRIWDLEKIPRQFISESIIVGKWQVPILSMFVLLIIWLVDLFEPYKANVKQSENIVVATVIGAVMCLLLAQINFILYFADIISASVFNGVLYVSVYALLFAIANFLSTARRSIFWGLPTPWTLKSDLSWAKTHRFLGRSLTLATLASIICSIALDFSTGLLIYGVGFTGVIIASIIYSYMVWKTDPERKLNNLT